MKKHYVLVALLLLPALLSGASWTTSIKVGARPDSITYHLAADAVRVSGTSGVWVGLDSAINVWSLPTGYRYDAVYKVWWPGMEFPVGGSQRVRNTKTAFASTEKWRPSTAYWPIRANATLRYYLGVGGDSLVFSGTRNDTTDYDTLLTIPKGHFGRAVVTINYTGTSGVEETWSYDLTDTSGAILFPPIAGHTCRVWLLVKNPDGTPASGVTVVAMLARSEVRDSSGVAVLNKVIRKTTLSDGKASFDLLYSDYMVPQTRWLFVGQSPSVALLRKSVLVPSQDQWYLDFSDTTRVR